MNLRLTFSLSVAAAILASGCATRSVPLRAFPAPSGSIGVALNQAAPGKPTPDVSIEDVRLQMASILGDADATAATASVEEFDISSDLEILSFASNERVNYFVDVFSGRSREQTRTWLSRGTRFEPMIRSKLRDAGLPEDLYYLAFIESGYSPDAYSSAAAVGVWQFMTATAKDVGLKVDWWVDERRDPYLSTEGAVKHLVWLRNQFGSLFLAAAAYNGGSGLVSRGLTRHANELSAVEGESMFFALAETNYLREETRDYVPKLIAAALVAKRARTFDILYDSLPPFEFDSVRVGPAVPLAAVARAAGAELDEITQLNNHVLRGLTHPKDSMWIRVPGGTAEGFRDRFASVPASELTPYSRVTSKAGETFAAVAKRVGVPAKRLAWYNPRDGASSRALPAGTTILVPSNSVLAAAKDVPNPAIEIYGSSGTRHTVKSGDTLGAIAIRYRTSVANVRKLNGLRNDVIRIGQVLRVR